jgi:hypothetical protein
MSEFDKIIVTAGLAYAGSMISVLVGFWLSSEGYKRRAVREHKRKLRVIGDEIGTTFIGDSKRSIKRWWIESVDDFGVIKRYFISRYVTAFCKVGDPYPDWSAIQGERTAEKSANYSKAMEDLDEEMKSIIQKIVKFL